MEAVLFTVDEWLRFRGGDSRLAMSVRIILGVLWFPISYLARFNMVVFIEPVFNPVKFPVCSIATKVMVPMYPFIRPWLMETFTPLFGHIVTLAVVTWLLFWLPDVFGFLFWEMKENWSLYRANRGTAPHPALIGTHGETMQRLLQPGFHSGTVPKLFAKLRVAEQKALESGNFGPVRAWRAALDEVEEAIRLFVNREFLVLLEQEGAWKKQALTLSGIRLATNQVRVELRYQDFPEQPLELVFEERDGILNGGMTAPAWLKDLAPGQRYALDEALGVLFELAGAADAREHSVASPHNGMARARNGEPLAILARGAGEGVAN